jgi:hypothetical protein
MPRLYHPQYERKTDRRTRLQFTPARLEGRVVAAAEVADADMAADLLARGWRVWPGQAGAPAASADATAMPEDLNTLTIPQIRALADARGVDLGAQRTKADLIDALLAATSTDPQDPPAGASEGDGKAPPQDPPA